MAVRINNIVLSIDEDLHLLKDKTAKKLNISKDSISAFRIIRESIDARKKDNIKFNYSVELSCTNEEKVVKRAKDKDISLEKETQSEEITPGNQKLSHRPVIVGMGPAGLFAGLLLARKGYRPIIFERGEDVDSRTKIVEHFWNTGELKGESNVQFGEGGAGTFSDGKLTTRIKDKRCDFVLAELVKAGAPEEIIYSGKPHVGTDILKDVVKNIRQEIIAKGGEVHFNSRLEDIIIQNRKIVAVKVNGNEIPCELLLLAIGHSSRDTYEMLYNREVFLSPKPFSIGVRVEHPQKFIDEAQYGKYANHPRLRAADYRVAYTHEPLKRSVYSFCMCPGGAVVAAASEYNRLVTNGMSYYKRDKENANSALVVSVSPEDFQGTSPLRGMEFQRHYEELAYSVGGGNYEAPVQLVGDFLKDKNSTAIGKVTPSYKPGWNFVKLEKCLPNYVIDMLKIGLVEFDKKIKGFAMEDAVLTGIETRTSAPVRIDRKENLQSISTQGLYPVGEGAGYAGGIISAAVDGLRVAEEIVKTYNNQI
ncbi:NAD(P)/FAD-dependent oxidoreductase [Clostridium thermarum]|uniref:NAD(P)/FAD-dependent oxidoreductase n=1 Tax=Clostridium thermarum TaxID=1716543 RepID=UPI00111D18CE|nr:NAD(P)/FAD-dependent oxidoreductase [Clostridium thermarum]